MGIISGTENINDGLTFCIDAGTPRSYVSTGSTIFKDLSGNNNDWNVFSTNGFTGKYLTLDGVSDYCSITSLPEVKWQNWDTLTLEMGFRIEGTVGATNNRYYLFDFRDAGGVSGAFGLYVDIPPDTTSGLTLFHNTSGTSFEEINIVDIVQDVDYIYQLKFNKLGTTNNINHWINGVNVYNRSKVIGSISSDTGNRCWIGKYGVGTTTYETQGRFYFMRVYVNKLLTDDELQRNYKTLSSRFGL